MRGERNEKRVKWREEREKKNKEIIYMVNSNRVYIHGYYSFARPLYIFRHFYKNWCGGFFALKCVKLSTFCILEDYPWAGVVALTTTNIIDELSKKHSQPSQYRRIFNLSWIYINSNHNIHKTNSYINSYSTPHVEHVCRLKSDWIMGFS